MILYINTTEGNNIEIAINKGDNVLFEKKFEAERKQAEKLLPEIDKLLKKAKLKLSDLEKIEVGNRGGSFTALRIGVVTANALGYALGIPVLASDNKNQIMDDKISVVEPKYDREPDITEKQKR